MQIWRLFFLSIVFLGSICLTSVGGKAEEIDWIMIEARMVPQNCAKPMECIPKSSLILRNLAFMEQKETRELALFLNRIATVRGLGEPQKDPLNYSKPQMVDTFHAQATVEKQRLLKDHPGVYFDSTSLDSIAEVETFSDYIRTHLSSVGLKFLSKDELERTPGRPKLSVRFNRHRESEGCIIPFSVSLSITEESVLVRDPSLKTTSTIWSGSVRENLANRNDRPSSAIRELVEKFQVDWQAAHS